ncbi:helix-turn-helix domain-containing protein [Salmonella enterica subsp. enterica serovar Enteritidis]|nr:helix-turn-helix domain-containing protein [Salmonella enterica subsp. enterica serovar Enteritidis]
MRKKREEIAPPEATQRLRAIWDAKKRDLKLTQEIAADLMGFETQSTVSHYLNGKAPLNTNAALKFSVLLRVKPEELRPDLADLMNYVRSSGTYDDNFEGGGWRMVSRQQADLLNLFDILPESEKEKLIDRLKGQNELYKEAFQNMLAAQKRLKNQ